MWPDWRVSKKTLSRKPAVPHLLLHALCAVARAGGDEQGGAGRGGKKNWKCQGGGRADQGRGQQQR